MPAVASACYQGMVHIREQLGSAERVITSGISSARARSPAPSSNVYRIDGLDVTAVNGNQHKVEFGYTRSPYSIEGGVLAQAGSGSGAPHRIVGMTYSAPARIPVGQRAVMVFSLV